MTTTSKARRKERAKQEQSITLSDEAAARAFTHLSDEATRLLWAMVRVIASTGTTCGCIGDAVATTRMSVDEAVIGLDELRRTGLLQRTPRGTDRLHPLFGSIAHRLFEFGHDAGDGGRGREPGVTTTLQAKGGHLTLAFSSTC